MFYPNGYIYHNRILSELVYHTGMYSTYTYIWQHVSAVYFGMGVCMNMYVNAHLLTRLGIPQPKQVTNSILG